MILKQGHTYIPMPHDGKTIWRIYRGGRCYYKDSSPYSLAATQALKAAFPQYWTAIRDYGYAHPQLVPFVNEDPMLIVSLVEVGKTRWLVGDGELPKISTGISLKGVANLGIIFKYEDVTSAGCSLGSRVGAIGSNGLMIQLSVDSKDNVRLYMVPGGVTSWPVIHSNLKANQVNEVEVDFANNLIISNGAKASRAFNESAKESATLFCSAKYAAIERVWADQNTLLPYNNGTECGMLDIVSLTFYPNANTEGSFTIEITDKE